LAWKGWVYVNQTETIDNTRTANTTNPSGRF
jgi:hypothetical protein